MKGGGLVAIQFLKGLSPEVKKEGRKRERICFGRKFPINKTNKQDTDNQPWVRVAKRGAFLC